MTEESPFPTETVTPMTGNSDSSDTKRVTPVSPLSPKDPYPDTRAPTHVRAREAPKSNTARADELVLLFDEIRVQVFGASMARLNEHGSDIVEAGEFLEAGLTIDAAARMFRDTQEAKLKAGERPIDSLRYYAKVVPRYISGAKADDPLKNFVYAEDQERMEASLRKVKAEIDAKLGPPPVDQIAKLLAERGERERAAQEQAAREAEAPKVRASGP